MSRLAPDEYPALSAAMFAILANLPDTPRPVGARVGYADLTRRQETTAEIEAAMQADRIERCCTLEFALSRPKAATLQGRRTAEINAARVWTPEMRARAAEAQRLRGERQRAERALLAADEADRIALARAEEKAAKRAEGVDRPGPPTTAEEERLAARAAYRRQLRARRKKEPRPKVVKCVTCGEQFKPKGRGAVVAEPTCSRTCRNKLRNKLGKEQRAASSAAPTHCVDCKVVEINRGHAGRGSGRYTLRCKACQYKRKKARAKARDRIKAASNDA